MSAISPDQLLHPTTHVRMMSALQLRHHAYLLEGMLEQGSKEIASWMLHSLDDGLVTSEIKLVEPVDGRAIGLAQIRELIEHMWRTPPRASGIRAGIVLQAERMSTEAANALLKLLEEPPDKAMLVLTAGNSHQLLDTIRSRVLIVPVLALENKQLLDLIPTDSAAEIAELSHGLPLRAQELVDTPDALSEARQWHQQIDHFLIGDLSTRFAVVGEVVKQSRAEEFVRDLLYTFGQKSSILERSAEIEASIWCLGALEAHVQPKLVLEWLALQIS